MQGFLAGTVRLTGLFFPLLWSATIKTAFPKPKAEDAYSLRRRQSVNLSPPSIQPSTPFELRACTCFSIVLSNEKLGIKGVSTES